MRELRSFKAEDREWDHFKVSHILEEAVTALKGGDHRHAAELWEKAVSRNKREAEMSPDGLEVLLGLRRTDEAERIMLEWQARKPADPRYSLGLVHVANAKRDYAAAVTYAAAVRKRFPVHMEGYALGITALRDAQRLPEAEALAEQGMRRFPQEVRMFMEYAAIATAQQNLEAGLERWNTVRDRFNHPSGYGGAADILIKLGRYAEADELLEAARFRYPIDDSIARGWALCAQERGDTTEAIARWKRIADRFPMHMISALAAASALEKLGAADEALPVLQEASERMRHDPRPLRDLGALQLRLREFAGAVETFARLRNAFPDHEAGYAGGAEALTGAGRLDEAEVVRSLPRIR